MFTVVPRVTTPITGQEALDSLLMAWRNEFGELPDRNTANLILALCWVETARGKLQNFNPGNLIATTLYTGTAWRPTWYEPPAPSDPDFVKLNELHTKMLKGEAPSAFRAYDTLPKGFGDWVHNLHSTFPEVVKAAGSGNANTFRVALAQKYSGDYANPAHTQTFASIAKSFEPLTKGLAESPPLSHSVPSPSPSVSFSGPSALPVLRVGSRGSAVALWQRFLNKSSIVGTTVTVSGVFDGLTAEATRMYQAAKNLSADSVVGEQTWNTVLFP